MPWLRVFDASGCPSWRQRWIPSSPAVWIGLCFVTTYIFVPPSVSLVPAASECQCRNLGFNSGPTESESATFTRCWAISCESKLSVELTLFPWGFRNHSMALNTGHPHGAPWSAQTKHSFFEDHQAWALMQCDVLYASWQLSGGWALLPKLSLDLCVYTFLYPPLCKSE